MFSVHAGEFFGFLGPNGAGKTVMAENALVDAGRRFDGRGIPRANFTAPDAVAGRSEEATAEAPETAAAAEQADALETDTEVERASAESDVPGGHADPEGQNVDHQFEGQE